RVAPVGRPAARRVRLGRRARAVLWRDRGGGGGADAEEHLAGARCVRAVPGDSDRGAGGRSLAGRRAPPQPDRPAPGSGRAMTLGTVALYLHILGAMGLVVALALEWVIVARLRTAETAEQARTWLGLTAVQRRLGPAALAAILIPGLYLAATGW